MPCFVAQSFVLAAFATLVCQRNCVFLCKGTKVKEFGLCRFFVAQSFGGQSLSFRPTLLPLETPVLPDQRFCRWKLLFYQQPCAKAKEFGEAEFWDSMPVFYGRILYWLLEKQGKLYFLQSSQTKGRDVLAAFATRFCLRHCVFLCKGTKLQKAALFAIVCRFSPWNVFPPMKQAF